MKSTVLYHKNGTLAEERFKHLTPLQWLFHYHEITKFQKEENKKQVDIINRIIEIAQNDLTDKAKFIAYLINPQNGAKYEELKNLEAARKEIPEEEAFDYWENLKKVIPKKIISINPNTGPSYILPRKSIKDLGIHKK